MRRLTLFLTMGGLLLFAWLSVSWAMGDGSKGKAIYERLCTPCHGMSGKGDGPAGVQLPVRPRNHTDKKIMSRLTDQDIFNTIKGGGASVGKSPMMPPFSTALQDDQIWDVVAYVRTLSEEK